MHINALLVFVVMFCVSLLLPESRAKGITEISSENSVEYIGDHYDSRHRSVQRERMKEGTEIIGVDQSVVLVQFERYILSVPRIHRRRRKKFRM